MQVSAYDIHHYARRIELALIGLDKDQTVSPENRTVIRSYIKFRDAQGLSIPRQVRYIFTIGKLSKLLRSQGLEGATRADLISAVSQIEKENTSIETKRTEKECVKQFYRWLRGGDDGGEYPPEVAWIKSKRSRRHSALPETLLTEDEVKRMAGILSQSERPSINPPHL